MLMLFENHLFFDYNFDKFIKSITFAKIKFIYYSSKKMKISNLQNWFLQKQTQFWNFLSGKYILGKKVPLSLFVKILYEKVTAPNLHQQASSIAFAFSLSLFPTLLFLFSLIPFIAHWVGIPKLSELVLDLIQEGVPDGIFKFIAPTLVDVFDNRRTDMLSLSFVFAIYAASSGVMELINTFNDNYVYSAKKSWIYRRMMAIGLAFLLAFLMILGVLVIMGGELTLHILVSNYLLTDKWTYFWLLILRYTAGFLVFYVGISLIYYIAPAVRNRWNFFSFGSTLSTILALSSTYGFSYYLSNFATYNRLYGSIGTIIAMLVWLYMLAWVLLLGFALNAGVSEAKIEYAENKN